jgi:hypothetical protein
VNRLLSLSYIYSKSAKPSPFLSYLVVPQPWPRPQTLILNL